MKKHIDNSPQILSLATAVPGYTIPQSEVRNFAAHLFEDTFHEELERLLPVFDNTAIEERHFAQPMEWFSRQHDFAEANVLYEEIALEISLRAARDAIEKAGISPPEIGALVFVSSTGIATPSLDAKIIQKLDLSRNTLRLPVWGLGCAGGVAGLARAMEISRLYPDKAVLFITVELCSLTFQYNDHSKSNLIATSLFADGAAALLLKSGSDEKKPSLLASYSTVFDDTEDIMGWDIIPTGLKVRFSRDIPSVIRQLIPDEIAGACSAWGINREEIRHYAMHPGGAKVIEAYYDTLGIGEDYLRHAREILRCFGNMSSPTVLFVLDEMLRHTSADKSYGLMMALGPGFSAEQLLFRW